jgi:hypothetical protein
VYFFRGGEMGASDKVGEGGRQGVVGVCGRLASTSGDDGILAVSDGA